MVVFQYNDQTDLKSFQAFETFINLNERSSEFISLYIDDHLKKGVKGVSGYLNLSI